MKCRFSIFLYTIIVCWALSACSNDDKSEEQISFHVSISGIEGYYATATVTHDGTNRDNYYCFAVKGHVTDVQAEIVRYLSSTPKEELSNIRHNQRKSVFRVTGLSPTKLFTCIVFGLDKDGKMYGTPASAEFQTKESGFVAQVNPNWTIEYRGPVVWNNYDYSLITVWQKGDIDQRFFLATYQKDFAERFGTAEDLIAYATEEANEKNTGDDFWLEDSQVRTESTNFYRNLAVGDYVSYAIGVEANGSPTGYYVKTDVYHVDKYPAVEGYSNLLGDWVIIDEDDKWYFVSFTERIVNQSLTMTGWGNYTDYPIAVTFNRTDASLKISSQIIAESAEFKFSDGSAYKGRLSLRGAYYNEESKLKWTSNSLTLAKASLNDDGSYTLSTGYYVTLADGKRTTNTGMTFYVESEDGRNVGFARMMFPLVMKKMDDL